MSHALARQLLDVIDHDGDQMRRLGEGASDSGEPGRWSRKEELGHLIDSAANNHLRFARATLDGKFEGPSYDQNGWVRIHEYAGMPWHDLVDFWERYNRLLARLIERVPAARLDAQCTIGDHTPATLEFLISDYIGHLRHHLDHILGRNPAA